MSALNTNELPFIEKSLYLPTFEEVKKALTIGLKSNFKHIQVDIVNEPPNLCDEPFHLAGSGLSGSPVLIEIGGAPYLLPLVDRTRLYDIKEICQKLNSNNNNEKDILVIGAGAGPYTIHNTNCEGIFNLKINTNGTINNETHIARVDQKNTGENCLLEKVPATETKCALLANLFMSEGKPGKVIHIQCKERIGSDDFIASIRKSLLNHFTDKTVGLGGVFILRKGTARQHVMRDFSQLPINNETELNEWLKFYNMPAILIAVGTLITDEADLDLRLQHFHSFSKGASDDAEWGGHYHNDVTPDIVEYEGYFNIAEKIIRIDQPIITHKFGRD